MQHQLETVMIISVFRVISPNQLRIIKISSKATIPATHLKCAW